MAEELVPNFVTAFLTQKETNLIILGIPKRSDYEAYLNFFRQKNVKHWFICCEMDQGLEFFGNNGIEVHSIEWEDGSSPPNDVIMRYLPFFHSKDRAKSEFIAVACKHGFGRAPTIGAISLIEKGFTPVQTLTWLREVNPRFITEKQKTFILSYKKMGDSRDPGCGCIIL